MANELELLTPDGQRLVRFEYSGGFRDSAYVEVTHLAANMTELSLLMTFGWFLTILKVRGGATLDLVLASGTH